MGGLSLCPCGALFWLTSDPRRRTLVVHSRQPLLTAGSGTMRFLSLLAIATLVSCGGPSDSSRARDRVAIELFDGRTIPAMPELLGMQAQYELRLDVQKSLISELENI